jgi:hypothetical protein
MKRYSRLSKSEAKRNVKKAFYIILLTIAIIAGFIFYGISGLAKFSDFLISIRQTNQIAQKNDLTPPTKPAFDFYNKYASNSKFQLKGKTESSVEVIISFNGKIYNVLSNNEGSFLYDFNLQDGENIIFAYSQDQSGNKSPQTEDLIIIFDDKPPELEITNPENEKTFYGSFQRQATISGKTEAGVDLKINDRVVIVREDGSFSYTATLNEGENYFNASAEDKAGNKTELSITLYFYN